MSIISEALVVYNTKTALSRLNVIPAMAIGILAAVLFLSLPGLSHTSRHLPLTALLSHANGTAYFECWQMQQPFSDYPTVGSAIIGLADVSNFSYVVLPPRSSEGLHKPPHPMSDLFTTSVLTSVCI
jgi:hypothetical protein